MSVIDKLKEAQEVRQNKYSRALRKSPSEQASAYLAEPNGSENQLRVVKSQSWMFKGILALLVVLVFAVSLVIFLLLRNASFEKKEIKPVAKPAQLIKSEPKAKVKAKAKTAATVPSSRQKISK